MMSQVRQGESKQEILHILSRNPEILRISTTYFYGESKQEMLRISSRILARNGGWRMEKSSKRQWSMRSCIYTHIIYTYTHYLYIHTLSIHTHIIYTYTHYLYKHTLSTHTHTSMHFFPHDLYIHTSHLTSFDYHVIILC